jgi:hypothetical protein
MHVHDGGVGGRLKRGDCQLDTPNITISGEGNGVVEARPLKICLVDKETDLLDLVG